MPIERPAPFSIITPVLCAGNVERGGVLPWVAETRPSIISTYFQWVTIFLLKKKWLGIGFAENVFRVSLSRL
jgi:hypothetical protein